MATAHRAPWVAKRAAEAGGSIVASVETVQMSSESGPEQQDSNNSSSSSTNIADTGKQDEVGAVTKLRMLAPWNEPRNRVYKDSSDFVNVVFAWYRKAWTKYPEEDLIRDEGVDKRGLAFVTLNCRHSATHGPYCRFVFTARQVRIGDSKCDLAKYNSKHDEGCPCKIPRGSLNPQGSSHPSLASPSTASSDAAPNMARPPSSTDSSKIKSPYRNGQFRPLAPAPIITTTTASGSNSVHLDRRASLDNQASSTWSSSHALDASTPVAPASRRATETAIQQKSIPPATGSNSTPISSSKSWITSSIGNSSTAPSSPSLTSTVSQPPVEAPSRLSSADPRIVRQATRSVPSSEHAAAPSLTSTIATSLVPIPIPTAAPTSSSTSSPPPFPLQKDITSPVRRAVRIEPTDPSKPAEHLSLSSTTEGIGASVTTQSESAVPRQTSIASVEPLPSVPISGSASDSLVTSTLSVADSSSTAIVDPAPSATSSISSEKIAIALPPKVAPPARKSPLAIVVPLPSARLPPPIAATSNPVQRPTPPDTQRASTMSKGSSGPSKSKTSGLFTSRPPPLPTFTKRSQEASSSSKAGGSLTESNNARPVRKTTNGQTASKLSMKKTLPETKKVDTIRPRVGIPDGKLLDRNTLSNTFSTAPKPQLSITVPQETPGCSTKATSPPSDAPIGASSSMQPPPLVRQVDGHEELVNVSTIEASRSKSKDAQSSTLDITTPTITAPLEVTANSVPQSLQSCITAVISSPDPYRKTKFSDMPIDVEPSPGPIGDGSSKAVLADGVSTELKDHKPPSKPSSQKRKPEGLVLDKSRYASKKFKLADISSLSLLSDFENSASPRTSISQPTPSLGVETSSRTSAVSPPLPTSVPFSGIPCTSASSARSSQSPLARLGSSETSVAPEDDISTSRKLSPQTKQGAVDGQYEDVPKPLRASLLNVAAETEMEDIVCKVESDGVDQLASSDMDLSDDGGELIIKRICSNPARGANDPTAPSPVSSITISGTAPTIDATVSKAPPAPLAPQRSLQIDELLDQKEKVSQAEEAKIKSSSPLPCPDTQQETDLSKPSFSEENSTSIPKRASMAEGCATVHTARKIPSPTRITLTEIAAMSSDDESSIRRLPAFTRKTAGIDVNPNMVGSSGKKYHHRTIVMSESESEEEVPIAQLAASLSSASSTPQLRQDSATMQVDSMPADNLQPTTRTGSNVSVIVVRGSKPPSQAPKSKERPVGQPPREEAHTKAKRKVTEEEEKSIQLSEEESTSRKKQQESKRQKRAAKEAESIGRLSNEHRDGDRKQSYAEQSKETADNVNSKGKGRATSMHPDESIRKKEKKARKRKENLEKIKKRKDVAKQGKKGDKKQQQQSFEACALAQTDADVNAASAQADSPEREDNASADDPPTNVPSQGGRARGASAIIRRDVQMTIDESTTNSRTLTSRTNTTVLAKIVPVRPAAQTLKSLGFSTIEDLSAIGVPPSAEAYCELLDMIADLTATAGLKLNCTPAKNPVTAWAQKRLMKSALSNARRIIPANGL